MGLVDRARAGELGEGWERVSGREILRERERRGWQAEKAERIAVWKDQ